MGRSEGVDEGVEDRCGSLPNRERYASFWWSRPSKQAKLLELTRNRPTPIYVYDEETLCDRISLLLEHLHQSRGGPLQRILYSVKANHHPRILEVIASLGLAFECVSLAEVKFVMEHVANLAPDQILFTPNFCPVSEYAEALDIGVHVTIDNLFPLLHHPEIFHQKSIFVRLDPGKGDGHHKKVTTAGKETKFGIHPDEIPHLVSLALKNETTIVGIHAHIGSGIRTPFAWNEAAQSISLLLDSFPSSIRYIDLGGGLGVPEKPFQAPLDLHTVALSLSEFRLRHPDVELWMEPGRFVVAECGVLLTTVTQTKRKGEEFYVGVDGGMNCLIRPALYGSYHEIVNLTRLDDLNSWNTDVVGPICETGDVLGNDRQLPECFEGDVVLVSTTGAYGRVMSSDYNLRPPPEEILLASSSL